MKNKFLNSNNGVETLIVKGKVHTIVKDSKGEVRYEYVDHNDATTLIKAVLAHAVCAGTMNAMDSFLGAGAASAASWEGYDGIVVHKTASTDTSGTLLACAVTANSTTNQLIMSGSNQLYDDNTMDRFVMGTSFQTGVGAVGAYFEHSPTDFEYSNGDTITVNWTVSVT
tara:strand:+ start:216 stop:722 length:507 start_codon:yes stop_codon:yes gene_type:complete